MSMRDWLDKTVSNLRGSWSLTDQVQQGQPARAFIAQNVRVAPGRLYSREGTTVRAAVAGKVTGMFNWLTSVSDLVLFFEGGTKLRVLNVAGGSPTDLVTGLTARGISVAEAGPRATVSFYTTAGLGAAQCRVTDGVSIADKAFEGPIAAITITPSDGGTGLCTQGTHYLGFVFQSRTGFSGTFSPAPGGVFAPGSITLNAGNRTINLSITLNTPATAGVGSAIYAIMTRADNPDKWFYVPGCFAILPASSAGWTQGFPPISITDEDMAARAEEATDQQSLLTQDASGNGPFSPSIVFPYRHRTVYLVNNKAYVSNINDFQALTEDQHVIQTTGQKRLITGFAQGQSLYLVGEKWIDTTSDNGDVPSTWSQPEEVAQMGTPAVRGIEPNTAGGHAWIANEAGLWTFLGRFDNYGNPAQPKPVTYLDANWKRINWSAAYALQVVDDIINLKCYVAAPLDGGTEPTHCFVIDYTNGLTYDTCDISLDNYNPATFSAICAVKEAATARAALWFGPSTAGSILVQDATTHNDNGAAIHATWESGFLREPEDVPSILFRIGGAHIRARGNGSLIHTWYGLDRAVSVVPNTLALSAAPGVDLFTRFDLAKVENASVRLEINAVDAWMEIIALKPYYRKDLYVR